MKCGNIQWRVCHTTIKLTVIVRELTEEHQQFLRPPLVLEIQAQRLVPLLNLLGPILLPSSPELDLHLEAVPTAPQVQRPVAAWMRQLVVVPDAHQFQLACLLEKSLMHALDDIQAGKNAPATGDVLDLAQPSLITDQLGDDALVALEPLSGEPRRRGPAKNPGNGRS
jgi:hypothetical protein